MKKELIKVFLLAGLIVLFGCKKDITKINQESGIVSAPSQLDKLQGKAKKYSSEGVRDWMALQLKILRSTTVTPPVINNSRYFAYTGIALYESLVPGMPKYRSLVGQLQGLPNLPFVNEDDKYYWPAVANASLAYMNKNLLSFTNVPNKQSMDSLENALNQVYMGEVSTEVFNRSVNYGQAVAQVIYNWSLSDGSLSVFPPYVPPVGPGLWQPTPPAFVPASTPYWGTNRLLVASSLNNSFPPPFASYSTDPSSAYYAGEKEVYDVSQSLTPSQIAQALYYRDNPGWPAGGHYLSILMQSLEKANSSLDIAAISYAKVGIAMNDCIIGCWEAKYFYNIQRPIDYIRGVLGHSSWNPLFPTPPHPDYPSGHSTTAGAAEVMLTNVFGPNFQLVNHSYDFLGMPPQTYTSFSDMAQQIGDARVLAGIHTRYACNEARIQGQKIAQNILNTLQFTNAHRDDVEE